MNVAIWCARMGGYSGVELYSFDLALALAGAGHRVELHAEGGFHDRYAGPLRAAKVRLLDPESFDAEAIGVNITPKYLPLHWAKMTHRPIVQVIHSEHPTDIPVDHPEIVGFVMIRRSQEFLLTTHAHSSKLPRRMIRNPIGFDRFRDPPRPTAKRYAGVLASEFDDFKVDLAMRFRDRLRAGGDERPVALVGPWRSELGVPKGCQHLPDTLDLREVYAMSARACSYRLSRTVPEALAMDLPVYVYGGIEPARYTREDGPDDWTVVATGDGQVDLAEFSYARVAAEFTEFFKELAL